MLDKRAYPFTHNKEALPRHAATQPQTAINSRRVTDCPTCPHGTCVGSRSPPSSRHLERPARSTARIRLVEAGVGRYHGPYVNSALACPALERTRKRFDWCSHTKVRSLGPYPGTAATSVTLPRGSGSADVSTVLSATDRMIDVVNSILIGVMSYQCRPASAYYASRSTGTPFEPADFPSA